MSKLLSILEGLAYNLVLDNNLELDEIYKRGASEFVNRAAKDIEALMVEARRDEIDSLIDYWYIQSREHTTSRYGIGVKYLKNRLAQLTNQSERGEV